MLYNVPSVSKIFTIALLGSPVKIPSGKDDALIVRLNVSVSSTMLSLMIAISSSPRILPANIVTV